MIQVKAPGEAGGGDVLTCHDRERVGMDSLARRNTLLYTDVSEVKSVSIIP
jgi:hypothetical protein